MDKLKIFLILLLAPLHAYPQQALVKTIEISDVQSAYVDRPGDLYILQKKNIKKYDVQGNLVSELKLESKPLVFDPRDGARSFVCIENKCSFFTEETKQEFTIPQEFVIEPSLICSSGDHNVWVLDKADFSLKKISPTESKMLAEVVVDATLFKQKPEILMMREYQNFLFILDKNVGIVVFNGIGKRIRVISEPNLSYFNFLGEEIYFKKGDKLVYYDLFDTTTREESIDAACKYALITDVRKYLVYENKVDIFENP
ncbi:MAG TPA: hypothetical protein VFU05_03600 [Cyclobacteriaceae bacterium]|nr:hypothetical protein [Cyclobacteriaceae bacterium]